VTLETRVALGSNTRQVALLQVLDVLADTDDLAHDLVSDHLRVQLGHVAPARRHGVEVGAADTAVLDLDCVISMDTVDARCGRL
jgi:hypothetical protein